MLLSDHAVPKKVTLILLGIPTSSQQNAVPRARKYEAKRMTAHRATMPSSAAVTLLRSPNPAEPPENVATCCSTLTAAFPWAGIQRRLGGSALVAQSCHKRSCAGIKQRH